MYFLQNLSHDAYVAAEKLVSQVDFAEDKTSAVAANFSIVQGLSSVLSEIQALSIATATDVADAINNTIVEEEEVNGVLSDANDTFIKAKDVFKRAQEARF